MPIYSFIDVATSEPAEAYLAMADAPDFGEVVEIEGRRLMRVVDRVGIAVDNGGQSVQAPRWDPAAPRHDKKGRPQFNNRREALEYSRRKNDAPGDLSYDLDG